MPECRLCRQRGKTWNGNDPKCAFQNKVFGDNWNCATMNTLRILAEEQGTVHYFDGTHVGIVHFEKEDDPSYCSNHSYFIVMVWYKRRGRVDTAHVLKDDGKKFPLTYKTALEAIEQAKGKVIA